MLQKSGFLSLLMCLVFLWACSGSSGGEGSVAMAPVEKGRVTATVSADEVTLEWEGEVRAITRLSGTEEERAAVSGSAHTFTGLEASQTFILENADGTPSIAYAYAGERTQPGVLSAIAHDGRAEIIWQALEGVSGYELYLSTAENSGYTQVGGLIQSSSARVEDLQNDTTYYFRVQAVYHTAPKRSASNLSPLSVIPGYTFGEVTAVTPGDQERHIRVFKAYLKGDNLSFLWDAVPLAVTYNFYGGDAAYGNYDLMDNLPVNHYGVDLPVEYGFFRVAPLIDGIREGANSQFIELADYEAVDWDITGGIESVTLTTHNYDNFTEVTLACMGIGESEWLTTPVSQTPFTAGWLEPMEYECKLLVTYPDNMQAESEKKRVTVYPYPDPDQLISVLVRYRTARLSWHVMAPGDTYEVLLSTDGGLTLDVVVAGLDPDGERDMVYILNSLECEVDYTAYVRTYRDNDSFLSLPVEFKLETAYCEEDNEETEGKNLLTKLEPEGNVPVFFYHRSQGFKGKLYIFGGRYIGNELWVYDPMQGDQGTWKELNPAGTLPPARDWAA